MSVRFDTHYEIFEGNRPFDKSLVSVTQEGGATIIFYAGVKVHQTGKGRCISPGVTILGEKLGKFDTLRLWQMRYLSVFKSMDPMKCAYLYRSVNNICHACCGDGAIYKWVKSDSSKREPEKVECTACDGTGEQKNVRYH
jgi:hypothetical protein